MSIFSHEQRLLKLVQLFFTRIIPEKYRCKEHSKDNRYASYNPEPEKFGHYLT